MKHRDVAEDDSRVRGLVLYQCEIFYGVTSQPTWWLSYFYFRYRTGPLDPTNDPLHRTSK